MSELRKDIAAALNKHSAEAGSDTPDFILAQFLEGCLKAYDDAVTERDEWHTKLPPERSNPVTNPLPAGGYESE